MLQVLDWGTYGRNHYYFNLLCPQALLLLEVELPYERAAVDIYQPNEIDTGYHPEKVKITVSTDRQEASFDTPGLIMTLKQEGTVYGCIWHRGSRRGDLTRFTILDRDGGFLSDCPLPVTFN